MKLFISLIVFTCSFIGFSQKVHTVEYQSQAEHDMRPCHPELVSGSRCCNLFLVSLDAEINSA